MTQELPTSLPAPAYMASQDKGLSQLGRFGAPESRFRGGITRFGSFSWRDLKFGTRRRANLEVWYPQKPPGQIATRRFSEAGEPNRRSWQKSGYQTSGSAKIRGPNHLGGTKSPVLGRGVPNAQSWHGGHQVPDPEEGRLIVIFKITRFYKQKNESFRYKITKSEWAGLIVIRVGALAFVLVAVGEGAEDRAHHAEGDAHEHDPAEQQLAGRRP